MTDTFLALDIGGTKMAAAVVDRTGALLGTARRPTPTTTDADEVWSTLAGLCHELLIARDGVLAVGVGCGGPMDGERVSPLNIPGWRGFPLAAKLRELTCLPVVLRNDAIAMAVGEHAHGAGRGTRSFLGVVVSTGVGGGLVLDGLPVVGPTGNAGHIGHVVVDADGPGCACGGRGCLEAIARGPAVVAWAREQGWEGADGRDLVASARAGEAIALAALTRAGRALGVAFASTAALVDVDVIAVGGGLAAADELLLAPAIAAFERHAGMDFVRRCRIVPATLGTDAGLVGAGVLAHALVSGAGAAGGTD